MEAAGNHEGAINLFYRERFSIPLIATNRTNRAGAGDRKVNLSWAPGKVIGGEDYLLQMTIPNTYFHIAMAYAILRHHGVDVGKMDFLGPVNLVDA